MCPPRSRPPATWERRDSHSHLRQGPPQGYVRMPDIDRAIRDGLDAWDRDKRNRLASLAGEAGLVWYEPGAWNCHLSATLQQLLRQCQTEGTGGLPEGTPNGLTRPL